MTKSRGFKVWAYLAGAVGVFGAFNAAAVIAGPGALPWTFDMFALLLTYAFVLICLGGVFEAIRHIRIEDGDMDWGEGAPEAKAAAQAAKSATPLRTMKTPA